MSKKKVVARCLSIFFFQMVKIFFIIFQKNSSNQHIDQFQEKKPLNFIIWCNTKDSWKDESSKMSCLLCNFLGRSALVDHIKNFHEEKKCNKCYICHTKRKELRNHLNVKFLRNKQVTVKVRLRTRILILGFNFD